ncbi:hypothetical protein KKC60_02445, partial [Patescibacteria group bacterium]|nr:hypothetical protein [Patescibacteria group bacterium]
SQPWSLIGVTKDTTFGEIDGATKNVTVGNSTIGLVANLSQNLTLDFSLNDKYFQVTPYSTGYNRTLCTGGIWPSDSEGKTLEVRCYDHGTETYVESGYMVTIF